MWGGDKIVWDKEEWKKEYAKKNRDKMNAYARDYYKKKNKAKHLERVLDWQKRNPDKVRAYTTSEKAKKSRRDAFNRYSELNREKLRKYNREWSSNRMLKEKKAKVIIENAIKRKFGHRYWIDNEGNIVEVKIKRVGWSRKRK